MTTTKSLITKVEKGSGNVYADLGMDNAEEMLVKAQLASKVKYHRQSRWLDLLAPQRRLQNR